MAADRFGNRDMHDSLSMLVVLALMLLLTYGVLLPGWLRPALPDYLAILDDDGSDRRVGTRRALRFPA